MRRGLSVLAITGADKQFWPLSKLNNLSSFSLGLFLPLSTRISLCVHTTDLDTNNFSLFISAPRSSSRSILLSGNKVLKRYTRPIHGADNCPASVSAVLSLCLFCITNVLHFVWWWRLRNNSLLTEFTACEVIKYKINAEYSAPWQFKACSFFQTHLYILSCPYKTCLTGANWGQCIVKIYSSYSQGGTLVNPVAMRPGFLSKVLLYILLSENSGVCLNTAYLTNYLLFLRCLLGASQFKSSTLLLY